jgi:hypothetical protein
MIIKICIIGSNDDLTSQFGQNLPGLRDTIGVDTLIYMKTLNNKEYNIRLFIMILSSNPAYSKLRATYYQGSLSGIIIFDKLEVDYDKDITSFVNEYRDTF